MSLDHSLDHSAVSKRGGEVSIKPRESTNQKSVSDHGRQICHTNSQTGVKLVTFEGRYILTTRNVNKNNAAIHENRLETKCQEIEESDSVVMSIFSKVWKKRGGHRTTYECDFISHFVTGLYCFSTRLQNCTF